MRAEPFDPLDDPADAAGRDAAATEIEQLRRDRERAEVLAEAARAVSGILNLERLSRVGVRVAVPALGTWAQLVVRDADADGTLVVTSDGVVRHLDAAEGTRQLATVVHRPARTADDLSDLVVGDDERAVAAGHLPGEAVSVGLRMRGETRGRLVVVRPTAFEPDDLTLVEEVAQRLEAALDGARLYGELEQRTGVLQSSLLPRALPTTDGLSIGAHFAAAAGEIGGDFYDVHGADGDWTVTVGDVTGKGPHAAVRAGQARHSLRTAALVDRAPAAMLDLTNKVLSDEPDGRHVTIACCRVRPGDGAARLDTAVAGHPAPFVVRTDGAVELLPVRGTIAGVFVDQDYAQHSTDLRSGDLVVLYTDGLVEARRGAGPLLGSDRVAELLGECVGFEAQAVVDYLAQRAHEHRGGPTTDDVAIVAVRVDAT